MSDWTIAVACCCINFLVLGMARLSPLLFVVSMERYNATRQEASFPFILCYLLRMVCGPLTGFLGNKMGLRLTTIIGCVACSLGIGLCFFAESIAAVTVLWGCVYGFGFGLGSNLLPAILSLNFKENLTKANGLAYFGSSLGAAVLPPVVQFILPFYGISGTFLILGGLTLNSVAIAVLLKIPDSKKQSEQRTVKVIDVTNTEHQESSKSIVGTASVTNIEKLSNESSTDSQSQNSTLRGCTNKAIDLKEDKYIFRSGDHQTIPIFKHKSFSKVSPELPVLLTVNRLDENGYDHNISIPPLQHENRSTLSTLKQTQKTDSLKSKLGSFHIFCDPTYFLIVVTQSIFAFGLTVVWTIIIDYMRDKGVERSKEIYFLVCLPVSDMIGRLGLGFLVDGGYMTQTNYCVTCYFLMGLSLCFLVWSKSFLLLMISLFIFSFITGGIMIGLPGMVTCYMKSKDLTMAMSSRTILYAPLSLTASPLIGFFRGKLKSYDGIFYISGALCLVCSVLILFIPVLAKRRDKKNIEFNT